MKKIITIFTILLASLSLVGCSNKSKNNKISINFISGIEAPIDKNATEIYSKVVNGDTFVLELYTTSCAHCAEFTPILNKFITILNSFIKETTYEIFRFDVAEILGSKKTDEETFLYNYFKSYITKNKVNDTGSIYTPSLVIIRNGDIIEMVDANNQKVFWEENGLRDFFNKHIIKPSYVNIDKEVLDLKIENERTFVVYFYSTNSKENSHFESKFFSDYNLANTFKDDMLFKINVDEYLMDGTDSDLWKDFAKEYGLDSYEGGKLPALVYFENGVKKDMMVFLNDVVEFDFSSGNKDTMKLTITNSFYTDFIGKIFAVSEYSNVDGVEYGVSYEYLEQRFELHIAKAKAFFDKYIKQTA